MLWTWDIIRLSCANVQMYNDQRKLCVLHKPAAGVTVREMRMRKGTEDAQTHYEEKGYGGIHTEVFVEHLAVFQG